jgi:hypothetical protein
VAQWRCGTCGEEHGEPPRDLGFELPDAVFALSGEERAARASYDSERCTLDARRHFVRAVLDVPTPDAVAEDGDDRVSFGVWVEVGRRDLDAIVAFTGEPDERERPVYQGTVANDIAGVPGALGLAVIVRPTSATQRPTLQVLDMDHPLGQWQSGGIAWDDWMRIVARFSDGWAAHLFAMTCARYQIELVPPQTVPCAHCGAREVRLTRFVSKDGEAHAIYYAALTEGHEPREVSVLLTIGSFGEGSDPAARRAFRLDLRPQGSRVGDATDGRWTVPAAFGVPLTRAEALEHPRIEEVFEILDVALEKDDAIAAYLGEDAPGPPSGGA